MSVQERIAKLEALLQRVRARSIEPRAARAGVVIESRSPASDVVAQTAPTAAAPEPVAQAPARIPTPPIPAPEPHYRDTPTAVPGSGPSAIPAVDPGAGPTVNPGAPSEPRLEAEEYLPAEDVQPDEEVTPLSSRRPVAPTPEAEERPLSELAFGEESAPPRHTPPPESGRLPAAFEAQDYDQDVTGVREASPPRAGGPEVIEPTITASGPVASYAGSVPSKKPATFGELLDDALSL